MNLLEIFKIGKKQYGIYYFVKIIFYELINLYRFRYYDYINISKFSSSLEPCVPTPYYILKIIDDKIKYKFDNSIFIDFGCGKGRVISCIKKNNFKKIIGIEINKDLNQFLNFKEINISIYNNDCGDMNFINKLRDQFLHENIILYFYHPFSIKLINDIIKLFLKNKIKLYIILVGKIYIDKTLVTKFNKLYFDEMLQIFDLKN